MSTLDDDQDKFTCPILAAEDAVKKAFHGIDAETQYGTLNVYAAEPVAHVNFDKDKLRYAVELPCEGGRMVEAADGLEVVSVLRQALENKSFETMLGLLEEII